MKDLFSILIREEFDYRGQHRAPGPKEGSPLYDVTLNGIYPDDVYSRQGKSYYGDGESYDSINFMILNKYHNKPDATLTIFRGVPKNINGINTGDWVTINRQYAQTHISGEKGYKVISKTVKARDIYTEGNSLSEWGYYPT